MLFGADAMFISLQNCEHCRTGVSAARDLYRPASAESPVPGFQLAGELRPVWSSLRQDVRPVSERPGPVPIGRTLSDGRL